MTNHIKAAISFHSYLGLSQQISDAYHYSQSVRIGSTIRTSGQCGFADDGVAVADTRQQIRAAFQAIEKALVDAGGKGWSQVTSVRSDLDSSFEAMIDNFKEFMFG